MDIIYHMKRYREDKRKTFQTLALITQLGLIMISSVGIASGIGIWLDRKLGTTFITVVMFFLGAIAGFQAVYRMVRQIFKDEDGKDDRDSEKDR